jgi:acetyl esterase
MSPVHATPHAQARTVLAERARGGGPPLRDAPVEVSRAAQWEWKPYMGEREPVARVEHTFIASPTAEIPVRVYTPAGLGPFPALVVFHGGCWVVGNIELSDRPHRALANAAGCVVVAVNYQKAPEHPFPVPLDDCYAAYTWTLAHAADLDVDPARVGVAGDSAGGNLATAVCLKARELADPMPAVQLLIYPAVDWTLDTASAHDCAEGFGLTTADMAWSWRQYAPALEDRSSPLVSPLRAESLHGLPPAVVVTAEFDVLRDEGRHYAHRLEADGVLVLRRHYDGAIHGFLWMAGAVDDCARMLADVAYDLRSLLPLDRNEATR